MSSRHLNALRGDGLLGGPDPEHEEEDEDEDDAGVQPAKAAAFELLLESSEEESEESDESDADEEDEQEQEEQQQPTPGPPAPAPVAAQTSGGAGSGKEDDDGFWVLEHEQAQPPAEAGEPERKRGAGKERAPNRVRAFFQLDTRALNAENEQRTRFGVDDADLGPLQQQQQRAGRGGRRVGGMGGGAGRAGVMAQLYARRCFLGPPKEDWPKPPTYVGGGMRMARVDPPKDFDVAAEGEDAGRVAWFAFEWSPALRALQEDYRRVQETCDPNALAVFLAHNPHHTEGLVTLALVLATHGMMDRAADNVRRCLFTFEAAYNDGFRAALLGSATGSQDTASAGLARLDSRRPENRPFFAALFRHLQMVGARGLYATAFEVGKLLLALDPTGDPMGVLLCLDFYALRAGKGQHLLQLKESGLRVGRGWSAEEGEEGEGEAKGEAKAGGQQEAGENDNDDDADDDDDVGLAPIRRSAGARGRRRRRQRQEQQDEEDELQAAAEEEETEEEEEGPGPVTVAALPNVCYSCALALLQERQAEAARDALREALLRFPTLLVPLVDKCRNELGSRVPQPWAPTLAHPFFAGAAARLGPEAAAVLPRVAAVYAQRSYDLWGGDPRAMQLLFDGAREVLREVEQGSWGYHEEMAEQARHYFPGTPLLKYGRANVLDYADEFPRLPNDVNPLNPALADPAIARRGRLRLNRHQPLWGPAQPPGGAGGVGGAGGGLGRGRGTLDPNLPLLELFWRSLLPWNTVGRVGGPR